MRKFENFTRRRPVQIYFNKVYTLKISRVLSKFVSWFVFMFCFHVLTFFETEHIGDAIKDSMCCDHVGRDYNPRPRDGALALIGIKRVHILP